MMIFFDEVYRGNRGIVCSGWAKIEELSKRSFRSWNRRAATAISPAPLIPASGVPFALEMCHALLPFLREVLEGVLGNAMNSITAIRLAEERSLHIMKLPGIKLLFHVPFLTFT